MRNCILYFFEIAFPRKLVKYILAFQINLKQFWTFLSKVFARIQHKWDSHFEDWVLRGLVLRGSFSQAKRKLNPSGTSHLLHHHSCHHLSKQVHQSSLFLWYHCILNFFTENSYRIKIIFTFGFILIERKVWCHYREINWQKTGFILYFTRSAILDQRTDEI